MTILESSYTEKRKFIVDLSTRVVEKCTIIGDAIMGKRWKSLGTKIYDYARTLCHYGSLALEFNDACMA